MFDLDPPNERCIFRQLQLIHFNMRYYCQCLVYIHINTVSKIIISANWLQLHLLCYLLLLTCHCVECKNQIGNLKLLYSNISWYRNRWFIQDTASHSESTICYGILTLKDIQQLLPFWFLEHVYYALCWRNIRCIIIHHL